MLNSISLIGWLVANPELKSTTSGIPVCSFTIACERDYKDSNGDRLTDFITIVAWRQTADFVARYFSKGSLISVNGSLNSRKWQDKDSNNRVAWEVQAAKAWFCESKKPEYIEDEPRGISLSAYESGEVEEFAPVSQGFSEDLPF